MRRFRFGHQIYLALIITFILAICLYKMVGYYGFILYIPVLIFECLYVFYLSFYYISIDDSGIISKTLFKKTFISWEEVYAFSYNSNKGFLFKYSVAAKGNYKKIDITNWIKNSKELIKIIVDECKKRDKRVDILVEKIIED